MGSILGNYLEIPLDLHMWCVTSCMLCLSAGQQKRSSKCPCTVSSVNRDLFSAPPLRTARQQLYLYHFE
jgi:hypothetical protein